MDGVSELAKIINERNNPKKIGLQIGRVITTFPNIKVSMGEKVILDKDNLIVSDTIYKKQLYNEDEVVLIPTEDEQSFLLVDKVVKL